MVKSDAKSVVRRGFTWVCMGLVVALSTTILARGAFADTATENDNLALQEIVVSATRVGEESIEKIPMAILPRSMCSARSKSSPA